MINTIQYQVRNYQQNPFPQIGSSKTLHADSPAWCSQRADENTSSVDIMVRITLPLGEMLRISSNGFCWFWAVNEAIGTSVGFSGLQTHSVSKVSVGGQEGWAVAEQDPVWEVTPTACISRTM